MIPKRLFNGVFNFYFLSLEPKFSLPNQKINKDIYYV